MSYTVHDIFFLQALTQPWSDCLLCSFKTNLSCSPSLYFRMSLTATSLLIAAYSITNTWHWPPQGGIHWPTGNCTLILLVASSLHHVKAKKQLLLSEYVLLFIFLASRITSSLLEPINTAVSNEKLSPEKNGWNFHGILWEIHPVFNSKTVYP